MRSARQPPLQFSFGRDPSREQRALLPQQPLASSSCALARFNLRPATVAFGRGAAQPARYACLASHQVGDESGDDEEGAVLPQRNCQRCCLFLCVLMLMAGGTGLVLRFLLARDSHPSSPAAKLAALTLGVAPTRRPAAKPPKVLGARSVAGTRTTATPRVVAVPVLRRSPPSTPSPPNRWPPNPPPSRPSPPPPSPNPRAALPVVVTVRHASPPPHPPPPPPSPPLPLREPGLLTIPAVAARVAKDQSAQPLPPPLFPKLEPLFSALIANKSNEVVIDDGLELKRYGKGWVEARNNKHRAKNQTRL